MIASLALIACLLADKPALEWRVLLIIKQTTKIDTPSYPEFSAAMRPEDLSALGKAFSEYAPDWISQTTKGRVIWKAKVVTSSAPLKMLSGEAARGNDKVFWVTPDDVKDDLAQHVKPGEYDDVFFCWTVLEDGGRTIPGVCWSIEPSDSLSGAGFSSLPYTSPVTWTPESMAFVREWLQQVTPFYAKKGVEPPKGDPSKYGFSPGSDLRPWYASLLNGEVEADGARFGLGEKAWSLGTVRSPSLIHKPEYLVGKLNLVKNGSFESGIKDWVNRSGAKSKGAVVDSGVSKTGKQSLKLWIKDADEVCLAQKIAVKPSTRYLLSVWVRTKDVVLGQEGAVGAQLEIDGHGAGGSIAGSQEWTFMTSEFSSEDRREVEVTVRLGEKRSVTSGAAWFDGVSLVEIPTKADKGTVEKMQR